MEEVTMYRARDGKVYPDKLGAARADLRGELNRRLRVLLESLHSCGDADRLNGVQLTRVVERLLTHWYPNQTPGSAASVEEIVQSVRPLVEQICNLEAEERRERDAQDERLRYIREQQERDEIREALQNHP